MTHAISIAGPGRWKGICPKFLSEGQGARRHHGLRAMQNASKLVGVSLLSGRDSDSGTEAD